jgi:hypothetical protein
MPDRRGQIGPQPFPGLPSQSPVPGAQPVVWQLPLVQIQPAWQTVLQLPQWVGSESTFVSQPLAGSPSQLPQPALQLPSVQLPPVQLSLAFGKLQAALQAPHGSACSADLQNRWRRRRRSARAGAARMKHAPSEQDGVPPAELHCLAQMPQFEGRSARSSRSRWPGCRRSWPSRSCSSDARSSDAGRAGIREIADRPQPPQFESVLSGASQPLAWLPSHSPKPHCS